MTRAELLEAMVGRPGPSASDLREAAAARFRRSCDATSAFFTQRSDDVSRACWDMARRFHRGGRLLAYGTPAAQSDAFHVGVEFVHPVIVGKRALPAIVLEGDVAERIRRIGRPEDIALGIASSRVPSGWNEALSVARAKGMLTVALTGSGEHGTGSADHAFAIEASDPWIVQEVHETLYHVLWELVHVFFDHEGLL